MTARFIDGRRAGFVRVHPFKLLGVAFGDLVGSVADAARFGSAHLSDGEHCATKLLWTRVQMGVIKSLQRTTLQELVDFASPQHTLEIHG